MGCSCEHPVSRLPTREVVGIDISEVWHDADGIFHRPGGQNRLSGPSPTRVDYGSFASFTDPDGNGWYLQEVLTRAPGR